jgi:hypothetical protein
MEANAPKMEAPLAGFIRSYFQAIGSGSADEQEKQLRMVCGALASLLDALLRKTDEWTRYQWVDGLTSGSVVVRPPTLEIGGLMVWGQEQYWEPFLASVCVSPDGSVLASYTLKFGNAEWGLGRFRYDTFPKKKKYIEWREPKEWLFEFTGGDAD